MENGDISNEIAPCVYVVFEGLIGVLSSPAEVGKHAVYLRRRAWIKAAACWQINDAALNVVWRLPYRVELLTYLKESEAQALKKRVEALNWPFASLLITDVQTVARTLASEPNVHAIYDANVLRWATYGSKGKIVSPGRPELMQSVV